MTRFFRGVAILIFVLQYAFCGCYAESATRGLDPEQEAARLEYCTAIRDAYVRVIKQSGLIYGVGEIITEEHTYTSEKHGEVISVDFSLPFYSTPDEAGKYFTKQNTISFSSSKDSYEITFSGSQSKSIIRDYFTLTAMALFDLSYDSACEYTKTIVASYDGETRSSLLYSSDYIAYFLNNFGGNTKVVVAKRGDASFVSNEASLDKYSEMNYHALNAVLNQGMSACFTAEIIGIETGMYEDVITVLLDDGHSYKIYHTLMFYPEVFSAGEEYKFYGYISETSDGEFQLSYAQKLDTE